MLSGELTDFFEHYRWDFESGEARSIADRFVYPLSLIADDGRSVTLRTISDRYEWEQLLEGLLESYRSLGVSSARIEYGTSMAVSERLVQASLRWVLERVNGDPVYRFSAAYTLVREETHCRIAAIAHDELLAVRQHADRVVSDTILPDRRLDDR